MKAVLACDAVRPDSIHWAWLCQRPHLAHTHRSVPERIGSGAGGQRWQPRAQRTSVAATHA
eukprot:4546937-Alexandrium_andersonii.AAC.1